MLKKLLILLLGTSALSAYANIPTNYKVNVYFFNATAVNAPTPDSGEHNGGAHWVLNNQILNNVSISNCTFKDGGNISNPYSMIDIPPHQGVECTYTFANKEPHDYINIDSHYVPQTNGQNGVGQPEHMGHIAIDLRQNKYFQSGFEYAGQETLGTRNHMIVTTQYAQQATPPKDDQPTTRAYQVFQFVLYDVDHKDNGSWNTLTITDPTTTTPFTPWYPTGIAPAVYNPNSPFNL